PPFRYDRAIPNILQAQRSAYEWHGRLWSPFLYCYASLGCRIENDQFRRELFREVEVAMGAVAANAEVYEQDELAKLRNLKMCVETGTTTGRLGGEKGGTKFGLGRLYHFLFGLKREMTFEEENDGK